MANFFRNLSTSPAFLLCAARFALKFFPSLTVGETAVFSKWEDVQDILRRDLDFLIEPVNKERIERVNGAFVLGLDRSATHLGERNTLYQAMTMSDPQRIGTLAQEHAKKILDSIPVDGKIDVVNDYARRIASRNATALTGIEGASEDDQMRVARAMFHELFLNLGGDQKVRDKALAASQELHGWCLDSIARERKSKSPSENMISRLVRAGDIDDDTIRRTVSGMFVGAVDTTATCVAQSINIILKRPKMLAAVMQDIDNPVRMRGWCWEALRFHPHNPIVLRKAARDTVVGNTEIKAGATVVCFLLAAMHDESIFTQSNLADPARPQNIYLHFGGGLHECAGRAVNGTQIPVLVTELLRRKPIISEKIRFEGPFPDRLLLKLTA